ncbi:hypothetical protein PIB30_104192, partial [Stylosanthes scabra]|nr:hypothetical protein [Stylosanthes scabra]
GEKSGTNDAVGNMNSAPSKNPTMSSNTNDKVFVVEESKPAIRVTTGLSTKKGVTQLATS